MGTWGPKVEEDDAFLDVYQAFIESYDEGGLPEVLAESIREEYHTHFQDDDDYGPSLFGLALACWETYVLSDGLKAEVVQRISSGADLANCIQRDADQNFLTARKRETAKFLKKLSKPRRGKRRRQKPKETHSRKIILDLYAPDKLKKLVVSEHYVNGTYNSTSGELSWKRGGGGLFGFSAQDVHLSAEWRTANHLHIRMVGEAYCQELRERLGFLGDLVVVTYDARNIETWRMRNPQADLR